MVKPFGFAELWSRGNRQDPIIPNNRDIRQTDPNLKTASFDPLDSRSRSIATKSTSGCTCAALDVGGFEETERAIDPLQQICARRMRGAVDDVREFERSKPTFPWQDRPEE